MTGHCMVGIETVNGQSLAPKHPGGYDKATSQGASFLNLMIFLCRRKKQADEYEETKE